MTEEKKKYLRQKDIPDHFDFLSKSTIIKLKEAGDFPKGKKILGRTIWTVEEIEKWLSERD